MCIIMRQGIWKFCCIFICICLSLPQRSHHQRITDEMNEIFFRKCCEEDQVYEYIEHKCIDRNIHQAKTREQNYPINFVHKDFSV